MPPAGLARGDGWGVQMAKEAWPRFHTSLILAKSDPKYKSRYTGPQFVRDQAYHNGIVWPWLIGGFLDAYLRVHNDSPDAIAQAQRWLSPLIDALEDGCLGQLPEIYEAEEPYRGVGCCAQAWSIAEVLRLATKLGM